MTGAAWSPDVDTSPEAVPDVAEPEASPEPVDASDPFAAVAEAYAAGHVDQVGAWLVRNAAGALGVTVDDLLAVVADDEPLTADDVGALVDQAIDRALDGAEEHAQDLELDSQIVDVVEEAENLGYEQGSPEFTKLLVEAATNHDGDLEAAHRAISTPVKLEHAAAAAHERLSKSDNATILGRTNRDVREREGRTLPGAGVGLDNMREHVEQRLDAERKAERDAKRKAEA
ncbi:MAG: hypothetical protein WD598_17030 [Acidimicrobiia bacterium]